MSTGSAPNASWWDPICRTACMPALSKRFRIACQALVQFAGPATFHPDARLRQSAQASPGDAASWRGSMEFRVLGPLEVVDGDRAVELGGPRQRALLAYLLVHANEAVAAERLVEELWGGSASGANALQVSVSRLRKALGSDDRLLTQPAGYLLRVAPGECDRELFEQLFDEARREARPGRRGRSSGHAAPSAGALAWPALRGLPLRALRAGRDRPSGGAPPVLPGGSDRRRPRARPPCRARERAGGADEGAAAPPTPPRSAHARPLPHRPPRRRARDLPGNAPPPGRGARNRAEW